jgi:predicted phosphodiesterase
MTELIISDLHLSDNPKDNYRFDFLAHLPDFTRQHDASDVYILGDLTEAKDRHSAPLVNAVVDGIAKLARAVKVIILKGNHDYYQIDHPFFGFLRTIPNITYISNPTQIGRRMFLPHTRNHKKDWKGLHYKNIDVIFTHNTFEGALSEHNTKLVGIPLKALPDSITTFSGDIHKPQQVGEDLHYVGAPYHIRFGDDFTARIIKLDGDEWESIHPSSVRKILLRMKEGRKEIETNNGVGPIPGDIVRIELELRDPARFGELREQCRAICVKNKWVLDSVVPIYQHTNAPSQRVSHSEPASDKAILHEYCQRRQVHEKIEEEGRNLL